jgi:hypothetical protein
MGTMKHNLPVVHWILMGAVVCFNLFYRRQAMDIHYGWPFEYGMDQWDVSNDSFPTLAGFKAFAFLGDLLIGGLIGFALAELTHRIALRLTKK